MYVSLQAGQLTALWDGEDEGRVKCFYMKEKEQKL